MGANVSCSGTSQHTRTDPVLGFLQENRTFHGATMAYGGFLTPKDVTRIFTAACTASLEIGN